MENNKILLSALLVSGTLTLGLPLSWSQGVKEGGAPQKKERMESPMGAKGEKGAAVKGSQPAASGNVKQAQQALKDKGHDPGPIDGILGPKTQAALKAFQEANKIKASGKLDAETKGKLGVSGDGKRESRESTSGPGK